MQLSVFKTHCKASRHSHSVRLYSSDDQLIEEVGESLHAALVRGESTIVIATEAHRIAFAEYLTLNGIDFNNARVRPRYYEFDAARMLSQFMVNGFPDAAFFSEMMGRVLVTAKMTAEKRQVFAFGEMVALLWADGNKESAIRLERLWNDLAHTNSFSLHCAYPQNAFGPSDSDDLIEIFAEHSEFIESLA
jgi:hypothetical protein